MQSITLNMQNVSSKADPPIRMAYVIGLSLLTNPGISLYLTTELPPVLLYPISIFARR